MAKIITARTVSVTLRDTCVFFGAWVRNPPRIGVVAPSSCRLAELITSEITPASVPLLEFGPGTGLFTRTLLSRGIPEDQLTLVECDP